jgi:hypothetical protein
VRTQFTRKVRASRMSESAIATSKFPLPVSSTVAVVSTRVCPRMLPPTISEAPTSEMTAPKAAIRAARSASRACRTSTQRSWTREAPRACIWRRKRSGICWTAASVRPITSGTARRNWARTMAVGV